LSVEQQKIDFKLGAAFDFTLAFKLSTLKEEAVLRNART
jgi:hypothetical protein